MSYADSRATKWKKGYESFDSIPSMISDVPPGFGSGPSSLLVGETASHISEQMSRMCMDSENYSPNEVEEKARLISQVIINHFLKVYTVAQLNSIPAMNT